MSGGEVFVAILFLAIFIEFAAERLFGSFQALKGWPMVLITAILGIALCIIGKLDALSAMGLTLPPVAGQVITGFIVGAGSNAVHSFFKDYLPSRQ